MSKEQTSPRVENVHDSEAAGVWWACPPTLRPLPHVHSTCSGGRKKHPHYTTHLFISDSQLKVAVDVAHQF